MKNLTKQGDIYRQINNKKACFMQAFLFLKLCVS
nr:MAG TPA: hypothetical protein [Caudoviricetes sp.]